MNYKKRTYKKRNYKKRTDPYFTVSTTDSTSYSYAYSSTDPVALCSDFNCRFWCFEYELCSLHYRIHYQLMDSTTDSTDSLTNSTASSTNSAASTPDSTASSTNSLFSADLQPWLQIPQPQNQILQPFYRFCSFYYWFYVLLPYILYDFFDPLKKSLEIAQK